MIGRDNRTTDNDGSPHGATFRRAVMVGLIFASAYTATAAETKLPSTASGEPETIDWWSLKPLIRPAIPRIESRGARAANPIDAFMIAKLREKGLHQSPEADRQTLIRRLYFDLLGLP